MNNLKRRWNAESTAFGKWLAYLPATLNGIAIVATETLDKTNMIPAGLVPDWLKSTLAIVSLVCYFIGKCTEKK